jgi:hypothetical protein
MENLPDSTDFLLSSGNNILQAKGSSGVSNAHHGCDEEAACATAQTVLQNMQDVRF